MFSVDKIQRYDFSFEQEYNRFLIEKELSLNKHAFLDVSITMTICVVISDEDMIHCKKELSEDNLCRREL